MKTFPNFLDKNVIYFAHAEVNQFKFESRWSSSQNFWPRELLNDAVIGNVSQTTASPRLTDIVANVIAPYIPKWKNLIVQHYIWHPLSGINLHEDSRYSFGATIYLTQEWNNNWGGLFVYEDGDELRVLAPTFNSINITTKNLRHMVTAVSPLAPYPRYTLQIWGN